MARQMKDSGIEWIGEIPASWDIAKVGYFFDIQLGKMLQPTQQAPVDVLGKYLCAANVGGNQLKYAPLKEMWFSPSEVQSLKVQKGDMLVVEGGDVASCDIVNEDVGELFFQNALHRVRPTSDFDIRILKYWLWMTKAIGHIDLICNKATIAHFSKEKFIALPVVALPFAEQQRIAAFLDRKCAEIDAVIERTKATIEEYKKLKQAVITEAVTKGVRGARPMKDSGIEWIGEAPVDWQITKVKWLLTERKDRSESGEEEPLSMSQKYGLIPTKEMDMVPNMASTFVGAKLVKTGDLVFNKLKAHLGVFAVSKYEGLVSPDYAVYFSTGLAHVKFLEYLFKTPQYIAEFRKKSSGVGAGLTRLYTDDLFSIACSLPGIDEQAEIVAHLNAMCAEMDTLIAKKTALLTELETYKKSLIYEYVTGKKECPEVVEQATTAAEYPYFPAAVSTKKLRFAQAMMMAKVLDMHGKGMGRVKLEKMLYTIETSIGFDFDTEYVREAAGPLHESIYKCEGIISRQNHWYQLHQSQYGVSYTPTKDAGKYRAYYDKYFSSYNADIERIIDIFKPYSTDQAEIVATLFAAWNDAIIDEKSFTDEDIVDDVLNNWHDNKKRFPKDVWLRAMEQMRKNNLIPKGYGKHTVTKAAEM